jgi:uncharacterized membrane protein
VDPIALGCIAAAAVMHAAWNILLKTAGDPLRTATIGVSVASVVLVPVVAVGWLILGQPSIRTETWVIGIVSGAVEVLYFVFLASAYGRGDLSVVYPLARGSAPLLAIVLGVGLLGERLVPGAIVGVALLVAGLLVVQRPWRLLRAAAAHDRTAAGFALLTGAMIATYSALDRVGVQQAPAWFYAGILWPTCAIGLGVVALLRRRVAGGRYAVPDSVRLERGRSIAGGFLTFTAYGLVLFALSRAELAIVAPLRESAVLLASTWALVRMREAADRREVSFRIAGALLVLAGAAALAIAG